MSMLGTVVNGVIVPDGEANLLEGARVRIEPAEIEPAEVFEYPHPLAPYDREKELALLRERIAETKAGLRGIPLAEAMDQIRAELNLPPADPE